MECKECYLTRLMRNLDLGSREAHSQQQRRPIQIKRVNLDSTFPFMSHWMPFPGHIPQASSESVVRLLVLDLKRRAIVVSVHRLLQAWSVGIVRPWPDKRIV